MISAVITNFNGKHILKKCLPETVSLLLSYSITDIIIADDCSTDDSLNYIKSSFPKVKTIKTPYNSGVSLACNVGASLAKENILLFLNNDMIPKLIDLNIVKELFKINTLFGFSPAIYRQIGTAKINETPSYGYFKGGWFNSVNNEDYLRNIRTTKPTPILWGCGGGLFVDHEKFKLLNGFDPLFFNPGYVDDLDLCYRAWKKGWQTMYEPSSEFFHHHQSTNSKIFTKKHIELIHLTNHYIFQWKNITDFQYIISHFMTVFIKCITLQINDIRAIFKALYKLKPIIKYRFSIKKPIKDKLILKQFVSKS